MKKIAEILGIFIVLNFFIFSCKSRIEQSADEFFEAFNKKDYEKLDEMADDGFAEALVTISKNVYEEYGALYDTKLILTNKKSEDDFVFTSLLYEIKSGKTKGTIYIQLNFSQKTTGGVSYITGLIYNEDKEFLLNLDEYQNQASIVVEQFYNYRIEGNYKDIPDLLKVSETVEFIAMLQNVEDYYGRIEDFFVFYTIPMKQGDNTIVILQAECSTSEGNVYYEEVWTLMTADKEFKINNFLARQSASELDVM